jgi:tRNA pseudouridine32 synthase/23S rRNA pseudouridine746 synthase
LTQKTPAAFEHNLEIGIREDGAFAPALLAEATGLAVREIKEAMTKGAVWLSRGRHTRRLRRHKARLQPGDWLHLHYDPAVLAQIPPEPTLIADEQAYSVWHKPYGMRAQGSRWSDHTTLSRWSELHLEPERPAFIVHRLDRAATGIMLLAHRKGVARQLASLFQKREIEKRYRAMVHGLLRKDGRSLTIDRPIDGKKAVSHVRLIDSAPERKLSLLEIRIETGRRHQIRRHLAELGLPILGDRLYGHEDDEMDLALTAVLLSFRCPVTGLPRAYELPAAFCPRLDSSTAR